MNTELPDKPRIITLKDALNEQFGFNNPNRDGHYLPKILVPNEPTDTDSEEDSETDTEQIFPDLP